MNYPIFFFAFISYLIGSIPFGLLFSKLKNIDIRNEGSGNIGATNVFRVMGKGWGVSTFILDFIKGYLPVLLFPVLIHHSEYALPSLGLIIGICAVIGHNYPIFLKFQGGKGVATSAGALTALAPMAVGVGLLTFILFLALSRIVSLSSMAASLAVVISGWFFYAKTAPTLAIGLTALCLLIIWRHRSNIQRLLNGTENQIRKK